MPSLQTPRARRFVAGFNAGVLAWRSSPRWGGPVRRYLTVLRYTGRRSGRQFSIPVGYRRSGHVVTIPVAVPDAKTWWRNFLGAGGPVSVELGGVERHGHAVSRRDDKGAVAVTVHLTPQSAVAEVPGAVGE